ncbi:hypothetical protein [Paenibacillus naphthalenovorans]|uniref:hypothetical protein n=1 Tax=Paenibacillus naphthalenovorans TaxID=162209 RepID=UPI000885E1FE|nr:hypothetical protein [Paenibacillus naphthalenovorans]SDI49964.1 hypothetical protein SAMN05421868_10749 [Paenibacillus naphthalenovorans]
MTRQLLFERTREVVRDIMQSPSAFRRIYEEERSFGNDVTLLPGLVVLKLQDGEVNFIWQNGRIVEQVYRYVQ